MWSGEGVISKGIQERLKKIHAGRATSKLKTKIKIHLISSKEVLALLFFISFYN